METDKPLNHNVIGVPNSVCFFKAIHFESRLVVAVHCWKHEQSAGSGENTHSGNYQI